MNKLVLRAVQANAKIVKNLKNLQEAIQTYGLQDDDALWAVSEITRKSKERIRRNNWIIKKYDKV